MANSQVTLDSTRVTGPLTTAAASPVSTVMESTIDHNRAAFSGGGIYTRPSLAVSLDHSTVSFNKVIHGDGGGVSTYGACLQACGVLATELCPRCAPHASRRSDYTRNGVSRKLRLHNGDGAGDAVEYVGSAVSNTRSTPTYGGGHLQRERRRLLELDAATGDGRGRDRGARERRRGVQLRRLRTDDRAGALIFLNQPNNRIQHACSA